MILPMNGRSLDPECVVFWALLRFHSFSQTPRTSRTTWTSPPHLSPKHLPTKNIKIIPTSKTTYNPSHQKHEIRQKHIFLLLILCLYVFYPTRVASSPSLSSGSKSIKIGFPKDLPHRSNILSILTNLLLFSVSNSRINSWWIPNNSDC